jgi:hypothetical protein
MKNLKIILSNGVLKKRFEVLLCESFFDKARGLCFSKNSLSLLFSFNKEVALSIHSLFCPKFFGVWFGESCCEIFKLKVCSNRLNVSPKQKFKFLLEVPFNNKNKELLGFIEKSKKQSLKIEKILFKD